MKQIHKLNKDVNYIIASIGVGRWIVFIGGKWKHSSIVQCVSGSNICTKCGVDISSK